ncbi:MAG: groL [Chloroflexi bacterium]|nr:groL [Chloroflexota bacterium]
MVRGVPSTRCSGAAGARDVARAGEVDREMVRLARSGVAGRMVRANPGPGLLFAAPARAALRSGVKVMTDMVRPTLGPTARYVMLHEQSAGRQPEMLDDAATILRRVIELPDPYVNMGAMVLRHAVWAAYEAIGDGGATTAVLFEAIVRHTEPLLAAGADPLALRRGLEKGLAAVSMALAKMDQPLEGDAEIARVAESLCHDHELSRLLGEIFDIVSVDGSIEIEDAYTRNFDRRYVEGVQWNTGFFSPYFITDQDRQEARLENPAILVTDLRFKTAEDLLPLLDRLVNVDRRDLFIIADDVSGTALSLLTANHRAGVMRSVAVKAPSYEPERTRILQDLAVLISARVVTGISGVTGASIMPEDLGRARVAWAGADNFGIQGGLGNPLALRERIADVRAEFTQTVDPEEQDKIRARLGKLIGGVAILQVGGDTPRQIAERKVTARRTVATMRHALQGGVAPGGGAAYLACQRAMCRVEATGDEAAGVAALAHALEEPLAVIARNAGHEAADAVARTKKSPPGWGFDATSGQIVDMWSAGILDPVPTLQRALAAAVSGAAMLLTAHVLVHHRDPLKMARP